MRFEEDGESPTVVLGPMAHGPRRKNPVGRLPDCLMSATMLGAALICVVLLVVTSALGVPNGGLLIVSAYAQSNQQNPLEKARTSVETLINRLRGRDMPEGIVKTNGRHRSDGSGRSGEISWPAGDADRGRGRRGHRRTGRCDDFVAGNRSPAARRAGAGPESQTGAGGSHRTHCAAQERSGFCQTDYERGKNCLPSTGIYRSRSSISGATSSKRRRPDMLRQMPSVTRPRPSIKAAEADVERLQAILVGPGARVAEKLDACSTGLPAPVRWLPQDSAF